MQVIHDLFGTATTLDSIAAVERTALLQTGSTSTDSLLLLADHHRQRDAYRPFAIRWRDRLGSSSAAIRYAKRHAKRQLQHYLRPQPNVLIRSAPPLTGARGHAAVLGAAYATALTVVTLAAAGEQDWCELLDDLRRTLAGERVLPPEVLPPA